MKLPGADTSRGMSGLGREQTDRVSLGRAQFEAATATGTVARALGQTADVVEAWTLADQETKANKALADYRETMHNAVTSLSKSPAIPVSAIPDGVTFRKTDANGQDRETIPTWEIAPAYYDKINKDAYGVALKQIGHGPTRAKLEAAMQNSDIPLKDKVAEFHFEGRRQDLIGKGEDTIQQNLRTPGGEKLALNTVDTMVKNGLITPKQGVEKKVKVVHDAADLAATRTLVNLAETENISGLEKFAIAILDDKIPLSADEKRNYASTANGQADRISKRLDAILEKDRLEASKSKLATYAEKIRLDGYLPSKQELVVAKKEMTSTDFIALVALIDRRDGGHGVLTDQRTYRSLENQILGLSKPHKDGLSMSVRVATIDGSIVTAGASGRLESKDRDYLSQLLLKYRDRPQKFTPLYQQAEKRIETNLLPPAGLLATLDIEDARRWGAVANDMKVALADATDKDQNLDPHQWVDQNLPSYKLKGQELAYKKLFSVGLGQYAILKPDGAIDVEKSRDRVRKDIEDGKLTKDLGAKAFTALSLGDPNARTRGTGGASNVERAVRKGLEN